MFAYLFLYKCYFFLYKIKIFETYNSKNIYVISVGNLTAGGAGKTPFVSFLSKTLKNKNKKHCIITRGYKKTKSGEHFLDTSNINSFSPQEVGDEPYMLAKHLKNTPIIVGNKKRGLKIAERKKQFTHAVIDDGFQTFKINKDYNILLIDFSLPLAQYKLLPLGFLREPLSEIKRANMVVFSKTNLCNKEDFIVKKRFFNKIINPVKQLVVNTSIVPSVFLATKGSLVPCVDLEKLKSLSFVGLSGIANPVSFDIIQKQLKLSSVKNFVFPDHFQYSQRSLTPVIGFLKKNKIDNLVITKKDFYKVYSLLSAYTLYVIDIEHVIEPANAFNGLFNY